MGVLIARTISEVVAPVPVIATVAITVGWHATEWRPVGAGFGALFAVFGSLVPALVLHHAVRRGRVTDHHIARREQRRNPMIMICVSTAIGTGVIAGAGAPAPLVATSAAMLAAELAVTLVNVLWWKISIHAAVTATGAVAVAVTIGASPLILGAVAVVANGWSRVKLGAHTPAQIAAGVALGASVSWVIIAGLG